MIRIILWKNSKQEEEVQQQGSRILVKGGESRV